MKGMKKLLALGLSAVLTVGMLSGCGGNGSETNTAASNHQTADTDAGRQKKARQKELLEEYLEKRAQMKEFQQTALMREKAMICLKEKQLLCML